MKITKVDVIPYSLPNKRPIYWATGVLRSADHLLVKIEAEDGAYGVSEAIPRIGIYGETQESIYYAIKKHLGPAITGQDSFNLEAIWQKMEFMYWNVAAKGAIDVALFDLNGKLLNLPCNQLLGGPARDRVPLSWQIAFASHQEMLDEMDRKLAEGYRAFKVKGGPHPDEDIKLLKTMRAHAPEGTRLYIDANITYGRNDTKRVLRALEGIVDCLEEPMQPWDENGRKDATDSSIVPILSDESTFTYADVYYQMQRNLIDIVGIKIPRTGFSISRKIVHLAEVANLPVQVCTQAESTLGIAGAAHFCSAFKQIQYPCELAYYVDNIAESIITQDIVIENGCMLVPEGPGNGVDVDWDKLKKFTVASF